jgi:hypothetical protein
VTRATRDYRIQMPRDVMVKAACEEVDCENRRYGFAQYVDMTKSWGRQRAEYYRSGQHGRTFRELSPADCRAFLAERGIAVGGDVAVFLFDAGQRCFDDHRTRPARLSVAVGGRTLATHISLADLAEDYTEHVGHLADQYQRG